MAEFLEASSEEHDSVYPSEDQGSESSNSIARSPREFTRDVNTRALEIFHSTIYLKRGMPNLDIKVKWCLL